MYLETLDDFQYLILEAITSMFIVLRNNMPRELIVYPTQVNHKIYLLPKIHLLIDASKKNSRAATICYKTNRNILSNSIIVVKQRRQRVESTNELKKGDDHNQQALLLSIIVIFCVHF